MGIRGVDHVVVRVEDLDTGIATYRDALGMELERTAENQAIVDRINQSQAQMLCVAYGAPRQDKWIARNREALPTVRLAMGVGGSLDFITGRSRRAPEWAQRAGVEWLVRLAREPWRWRRMTALPRFALKVLAGRHRR